MKGTARLVFLWVILSVALSAAVPAQKPAGRTADLAFGAVLHLAYQTTDIQVGEQKTANRLDRSLIAVEGQMEYDEVVKIGLLLGYHGMEPAEAVDFAALPQLLRLEKSRFHGTVWGISLEAAPFSFGDFSVRGTLRLLRFRQARKEWSIPLPSISSRAAMQSKYWDIQADVVLEYANLGDFTAFLGPQLSFVSGSFTAVETIDTIASEQKLTYSQKRVLGLTGGLHYDMGGSWLVTVQGSLFARSGLQAGLVYSF